MRIVFVALFSLILLASEPAKAQGNQMDPEQLRSTMEIMFGVMLDVMTSPDMAEAMARFYKNLYDALIAQGFTEEQAMEITTSMPLPISNK